MDIQANGEKIDRVIYGGEVLWERQQAMAGTDMQLVGAGRQYRCPTARTRVVDARDNATYWIQRLADGRCWMLTNLAYAGGGANTYNDVKTIRNNNALSYTEPYYMIPPGSNRTVEPQDPSTSTTGTGQYGYVYNWCAAMGGQIGTSACLSAVAPLPNQNISICPAGWRLPTGNVGGEYQALNMAVNGGSTSTPSGLLSIWLGMYGGGWSATGFTYQGGSGFYWSSAQNSATNAYYLLFYSNNVGPGTSTYGKSDGFAVRCLAQ